MALLIALAAALEWLNRRFLGLPQAVGLTAMGLLASLSLAAADRLLPGRVSGDLLRLIDRIDFHDALINDMLLFLLFAAAVQVNWSDLRKSRLAVLTLGSGLIGHSQKMTVAAKAMAERKTVEQRS